MEGCVPGLLVSALRTAGILRQPPSLEVRWHRQYIINRAQEELQPMPLHDPDVLPIEESSPDTVPPAPVALLSHSYCPGLSALFLNRPNLILHHSSMVRCLYRLPACSVNDSEAQPCLGQCTHDVVGANIAMISVCYYNHNYNAMLC